MAAHEPVDVLIIGSGATGSIAAMVLGQAGLKVVCLEQGGWVEPREHPHYSPDWQWQRRTRWNADVNVRHNVDDFPVNSNSSQVLMWNGVGGSTNVYGALWPRYRPSDFRKGQEHGLAPDWPIAHEDIAPYFDRADRIVGVAGLAGDPAMPPQDDYPTPPMPLGGVARRLAKGFDQLGWHWWPVPAGVISKDYDGRPGCNGCGICMGCPRNSMSKYSMSVWPKALEAGVELRTYARVLRIEKGKDGRATGAEYIDRNTGMRHFQKADVVILAANGVGTPRLLLASDNLANSSDQVGRNLLHHTLVACEMWVEEPLAAHTGYVAALISREFAETDTSRGFVNGFNFNCVTTGGAGEQANGHMSNTRAPWGKGHHDWFKKPFRPRLRRLRHRRRPAEPEQPGHALGLRARRRRRAGGRAALPPRRQRHAHDALHARPSGRDRGCRGCLRLPAPGLHRRERHLPHARLAPSGHGAHGQVAGHVGRQQVAPGLGRAEPLHHRRQRLHDGRCGEPHAHGLGAGAACCRASEGQLRRPPPHDEARGGVASCR